MALVNSTRTSTEKMSREWKVLGKHLFIVLLRFGTIADRIDLWGSGVQTSRSSTCVRNGFSTLQRPHSPLSAFWPRPHLLLPSGMGPGDGAGGPVPLRPASWVVLS